MGGGATSETKVLVLEPKTHDVIDKQLSSPGTVSKSKEEEDVDASKPTVDDVPTNQLPPGTASNPRRRWLLH